MFGIDFAIDSGGNFTNSMNTGPLHWSGSIGLDGITISMGLDINGKSYDISIGIGLGPVMLVGLVSGYLRGTNLPSFASIGNSISKATQTFASNVKTGWNNFVGKWRNFWSFRWL